MSVTRRTHVGHTPVPRPRRYNDVAEDEAKLSQFVEEAKAIADAKKAISDADLGATSALPRRYLGATSAVHRPRRYLGLGGASAVSRQHLGDTSAVPRRYLGDISAGRL